MYSFSLTRFSLFLSTLSLRRATVNGGVRSSCFGNFYPRSPCGERPTYFDTSSMDDFISIHALLAESDPRFRFAPLPAAYFYPRSPCGERLLTAACIFLSMPFLSTLSLRRATLFLRCGPMTRRYFYPRSPCGERRQCPPYHRYRFQISIHALLAESDMPDVSIFNLGGQFLSTLSLRRATL